MSAAYKKLFWGVFFANIQLHFGAITILPGFVGFLIAYSGLSDLDMETETASKSFDLPQGTLLALVILTAIYSAFNLFTGSQYETLPLVAFIPTLFSVMELVAFHKILEVSVTEFQARDFIYGVEKYSRRDRIYILLKGLSALLLTLNLVFSSPVILVAGTLLEVAAIIYLLVIFHSLKKDTEEMEIEYFTDLY
ncbi:hypothetical protein [Marinilactibacillus piezotolerans]|uniref:hypothetical protein n=1 Tax=Marinilactibacillus piezotolerans TaxID=258723 RepID=UPI0009B0AD73|nr:hypothetical protein [Marinilactibacillus piezotolerans]